MLIALVLSPILKAEFLWDDFVQIVESQTIDDLSLIPFYFTHNVVESAGRAGVNAPGVDLYRPFFMVALALIHTINGPDPFWFHLALVAVHLGVCLLLWIIASRWLPSRWAAAAAVLFFACHPVTAEAYLWPSAISEPMAAAGFLAAIAVLDRHCRGRQKSTANISASIFAAALFFFGIMSKEAVLMALPAATAYLMIIRRVPLRAVAPTWFAGFVFLAMRYSALGGLQATGQDVAQRLTALKIYPVLFLDAFRAMLTMQPIGVRHLSWEYANISWSQSALALLGCGAVLAGAVALIRIAPLTLTAVVTTSMMIAPIALVASVPGWGGFGRYLYVPLAMSVLALAELGIVIHAWLIDRQPRLGWAVPAVVVAALVVGQIGLRHALWVYSNQENLARAAIEIYPDGPDAWEWLGNVYMERGDLRQALEYYRGATERGPDLFRPRHNLAAASLYTGDPQGALDELALLESRHPPTAMGSRIKVTALIELGRWDEAAAKLIEGFDNDPESPDLAAVAKRLLDDHPEPARLQDWLEIELAKPEHAGAARSIRALRQL